MLYVAGEYFSDKKITQNETTNGPSNVDKSTLKEADDTQTEEKTTDKVAEDKKTPEKEVKKEEPKKEETKKEEEKKTEVKIPEGGESMTHTVAAGETFSTIAARYGLDAEALKKLNEGVTLADFKAGTTKLKVKVKAIHTVGPGDVLRVVAQKYGVSKQAIMKANGKTKDFAERGEKLIIPFK
jgi:LysM repeat protein